MPALLLSLPVCLQEKGKGRFEFHWNPDHASHTASVVFGVMEVHGYTV